MIRYPAGLPFMPIGWEVPEAARPNLESEMNAGVVRQRRQFTVAIGQVPMTLFMELGQFELWKRFHGDTLGNGAARFEMPVWNGLRVANRTVQIRNGGRYAYRRSGRGMMVSFALDVWGL